MMEPIKVNVQSEIGRLRGVILHTPGDEVENMTPRIAQRALYSDILNLSIAQREYAQLAGVLNKWTTTYQIADLLSVVLDDPGDRGLLLSRICSIENVPEYFDMLMSTPTKKLVKLLIEGLPAKIETLTAFLADEYYALSPLYNFYFTRDASASVGRDVLICKMANKVRVRESLIMESIFSNPRLFECSIIDANEFSKERAGEGGIAGSAVKNGVSVEGGDIIVIDDNILLVGNGLRTTSKGIDMLIQRFCKDKSDGQKNIIVQQLPDDVESFIHMDMVFTMLDKDACLIYEPLILGENQYRTVLITIENGRVKKIRDEQNVLSTLRKLGKDLRPVYCGGSEDEWNADREQWHSGANSFAIAPGKILSYARNVHTLNALDAAGFNVVTADDVIADKVDLEKEKRCVITIEGSELPRGGGGARCMTMPVVRDKV
ncbi:MAG: arginine deiminase [Bacteroidales bacterium]|nr:arginine deiminase [Bacteroidales bacterium]